MTAPLNGTLLNGGTPYATWAWGESRARATATAEPVIQSVHRYVDGEAHGKAVSTGITDRLAFLNSEEQPYADTAMAATRYAYANAQALATTDATITPVRTAWFDSSALNIEALSSAYAERWKVLTAQAIATAETNSANNRVYRWSLNKSIPGQARSWVAESDIKKIRVHQVYAKSDAVARAHSRALANTALGFSDMQLDAVTSLDNLKTNIYHNYRGLAHTESMALVDSSRIRIIEGGMPCTATIHAAPTITTATGRYSYNSGLSEVKTLTQGTSKVLRKAIPLNVPGISKGIRAETYLVRGMAGSQKGEASSSADAGSFTRVRASKEQTTAAAVTVASFNRYKWTLVSVTASKAQAVSYSTNSVAAYSNEVAFPCYALTEANYAVERWQDSVASADVESTAVGTRLADVNAKPTGIADVIEAAVRIVYLDGDITSKAESTGTEVRHAYVNSITNSEAAAAAVAERTAWMSQTDGTAEASDDTWFSRITFAENQEDTALSGVTIDANIYTLRHWNESSLEAAATSTSDPWRITKVLPVSEDAAAVVLKFVYRINAGTPAPDSRTVVIPESDRLFVVPTSNREYRIQ